MEKLIPGKILAQEEVKSSSSDNVYTVTICDNCIVCTCPAGGTQTPCKHMREVFFKHLELIKEVNIDFYNDLWLLFEMKNDKYHNPSEYKELSKKLIYTDKEISLEAHLNKVKLKRNENE